VLSVKPLIWSILLVLPAGAMAAEIYRSVDANGRVVYSDLPDGSAEQVTVSVQTPAAAREQPASAARSDAAESSSAAAPPGAQIPRPSTPEEIAADRAQNCEYARQMQSTYSTAHRLFRNGPDGERVYLSDAELAAARTKAESDVATWCD
jgi:Domain of unknown function (DUF4124)